LKSDPVHEWRCGQRWLRVNERDWTQAARHN